MNYIEWVPEFNLGVQIIDEQHLHLVEIINDLYVATYDKQVKRNLSSIIEELVNYAQEHFQVEEELFQSIQYIDAEQHLKEHHEFVMRINEYLQPDFVLNQDIAIDLLDYLKKWLIEHIMISDRKYISLCHLKVVV